MWNKSLQSIHKNIALRSTPYSVRTSKITKFPCIPYSLIQLQAHTIPSRYIYTLTSDRLLPVRLCFRGQRLHKSSWAGLSPWRLKPWCLMVFWRCGDLTGSGPCVDWAVAVSGSIVFVFFFFSTYDFMVTSTDIVYYFKNRKEKEGGRKVVAVAVAVLGNFSGFGHISWIARLSLVEGSFRATAGGVTCQSSPLCNSTHFTSIFVLLYF